MRTVAGRVATVLAVLLVLAALVAPHRLERTGAGAFVRVPAEALVGAAVLLALDPRWRRRVALVGGVALGLLTVLKVVDLGFSTALARPFRPIIDWSLFADAARFVRESFGGLSAGAAIAGAAVAVVAVMGLMTWATRRTARLLGAHRRAAAGVTAALALLWVLAAVAGAQWVPGVPLAAAPTAGFAVDAGQRVDADLRDPAEFAAAVADDPYRDVPADRLLTGLRGDDVLLTFVESYGRDALEDSRLAPEVTAALDDGDRRLTAAGYGTRSGWLTSSTAGGGSWLAHSTMQSGVWIDNPQRYTDLHHTDRLTLTGAFHKAGWRTIGVMPGITSGWAEAGFYGYDKVYELPDFGYRGPNFGFATMPDQFVLEAMQRTEPRGGGRPPLMAEITLVSSHAPWDPLPRMIGWDQLGDGSVFTPMTAGHVDPYAILTRDPDLVAADYGRSITYSMDAVIDWTLRYGDDHTVLIVLGDHQPAPVITGPDASRDVPITVIARDRSVLDKVAGWGWTPGLRPGPGAPVARMDTFRDRLLGTFGTAPPRPTG